MGNPKLTLLELTGMIGKAIRQSFHERYWLIAEINEIRDNINGHCYLELVEKDPDMDRIVARSKATVWAHTWRMLKPYFEASTAQFLSKGMMILVEVSVEFHDLYGLSLNIKDIDPVYTMGDLEIRRAETIRKLEKEGIINMNKALPFPVLPSRIAVVSSPAAAGFEDFTHQIKNNQLKYSFKMKLFPALMQGDNARRSITDALDKIFEKENLFDIVVILRGGGSASDLNCFDSYEIAAHIAQFPLPVITGIGHERDHTIAGMVANTDLKTPTAVAEFLIGKLLEQDQKIGRLSGRFAEKVSHILEENKQFINNTLKDLPMILKNNIKGNRKHIISTGSILARTATNFTQKNKHKLLREHSRFKIIIKNYLGKLKTIEQDSRKHFLPDKTRSLIKKKSDKLILFNTTVALVDPDRILKKGYALVLKNGRIIKTIKNINYDDIMETKLHDGRIESKVLEINIKRKEL